MGQEDCPNISNYGEAKGVFGAGKLRVWAVTGTHTLVELASLATGDEAFAIWVPGHTGQAVLVRLAHLCAQLPRLRWDSITNTKPSTCHLSGFL